MRIRFKAGALLATLVVSLVAMCICASVLMLVYYFRVLRSDDLTDERLDAELYSGINYTLGSASYQIAATTGSFILEDSTRDSTVIDKGPWGCFMYAVVEARSPRKTIRKALLYGAAYQHEAQAVLYLSDNKEPLALVGNTQLNGDVYLPRAGIKQGYLNQQGYAGSQLVFGAIDTSTQTLPGLDPGFQSFCDSVDRCLKDSVGYTTLPGGEVQNSFYDSLLVIRQKGDVDLGGEAISGKILIVSDSILNVHADARLDNVILMAPVIVFQSGFHGCLQAFAEDSIVVGQGSHLEYPSALVVVPGKVAQPLSNLTLDQDVTVDGIVMAISSGGTAYKPRVHIPSGTVINGLVYCNGYCYMQGTVSGSVFTDYFLYGNGPSIFDDLLDDAVIQKAAPMQMPGLLSPLAASSKNTILEWVR